MNEVCKSRNVATDTRFKTVVYREIEIDSLGSDGCNQHCVNSFCEDLNVLGCT